MELRQTGTRTLRMAQTRLKDVRVLRERHISLGKEQGYVQLTSAMSKAEEDYWNELPSDEKRTLRRKAGRKKDLQLSREAGPGDGYADVDDSVSSMKHGMRAAKNGAAQRTRFGETRDIASQERTKNPNFGKLRIGEQNNAQGDLADRVIQSEEPTMARSVNSSDHVMKGEAAVRSGDGYDLLRSSFSINGSYSEAITARSSFRTFTSLSEKRPSITPSGKIVFDQRNHKRLRFANRAADRKTGRVDMLKAVRVVREQRAIDGNSSISVEAGNLKLIQLPVRRNDTISMLPKQPEINRPVMTYPLREQCTLEQAENLARLLRQHMAGDPSVRLGKSGIAVGNKGGQIYSLSKYANPLHEGAISGELGELASPFSRLGKLFGRRNIFSNGGGMLGQTISSLSGHFSSVVGIGRTVGTVISTGIKAAAGSVPKILGGALAAASMVAVVAGVTATIPLTSTSFFAALTGGSIYMGQNQEWDYICYLASKYESGGNPDDCGGDRGWACGEIQFDARFELLPFVKWCYEKDSVFYAPFAPYAAWPNSRRTDLRSNNTFYNAWHKICAKDKIKFEYAQFEYVLTVSDKYPHWIKKLTEKHPWYDFENAPAAIKGAILAMGNRAPGTLYYCFEGITPGMSDEDIINHIYPRQLRSPYRAHYGPTRMRCEHADCLAMLRGTLDVYAKDGNAAGDIDWSYKRVFAGSSAVAAQVVAYCEQAVGSSYNRNNRMGERVYDCSSLAFRAYDSAGIKYLNGMTAAGEAEYLDKHGMTFYDRKMLQPGDLIFRTSSVTNKTCHLKDGRTTLVGHVEIYIGDGMMIHASGGRKGVVKERAKYSNLSVGELYGRPQP